MSGKPVVLRERARRDIDEAVEPYLAEAGPAVALDFIYALEDARQESCPRSCQARQEA